MKWQLTPLQQLLADPRSEGGAFYGLHVDQNLFPEITWSTSSGGTGLPPYTSLVLFKNKAGTQYIYLLVDYSGKIEIIKKEKCIELVGEQGCR